MKIKRLQYLNDELIYYEEDKIVKQLSPTSCHVMLPKKLLDKEVLIENKKYKTKKIGHGSHIPLPKNMLNKQVKIKWSKI